MSIRSVLLALSSFACCALCTQAEAASVYLTPASSSVSLLEPSIELRLFMDFSDEATLGGGIDLDLSGPISLQSFTPSAYFNALDPFFSGFTTDPATADNDFALWFGDFNGLSGVNEIGTLRLDLLGSGLGSIAININTLFGPFQSAQTFDTQEVTLTGATVGITPVPLPAAAWLLLSGLAAIGALRRRVARGS